MLSCWVHIYIIYYILLEQPVPPPHSQSFSLVLRHSLFASAYLHHPPSSNQLNQTVESTSCPSGGLPPLPVGVISPVGQHIVLNFLLARRGKQPRRGGKGSEARRNTGWQEPEKEKEMKRTMRCSDEFSGWAETPQSTKRHSAHANGVIILFVTLTLTFSNQ